MWKRNAAGIPDFALGKAFSAAPHASPKVPGATATELFSLSGSATLLVLIVAAAPAAACCSGCSA